MARRYCGMCDQMVRGRECPQCGADTDALPKAAKNAQPVVDLMDALRRALPRDYRLQHTCHDMNPPHPGPCAACDAERTDQK
jgi:hypothetical protein